MHGDRPGLELDLLAVAHPLVGALAVDLDRRDRGRHLLQVADELRRGRAYDGLVEPVGRRTVAVTSPSASSVVVATPSRIVASYPFSVSIR